jgi:hypothetical protein
MILVVILALAVAGLIASSAVAGKPSSASLDVRFPTLASAKTTTITSVPYNTPYVVSGCGYAAGAGVTVVVHTPEAISFAGQMPDAAGCIAVSNFSTQGAGHYDVGAYQTLRNKSSLVASMSFDLS